MIFRVAQERTIHNKHTSDKFIYIFEPFLIEAPDKESVIEILKADAFVKSSLRPISFYIEPIENIELVRLP